VTGVKLGTATFTAKYKGKSATFDVTVADTAPTSAARL
jgi:hypothetical protein